MVRHIQTGFYSGRPFLDLRGNHAPVGDICQIFVLASKQSVYQIRIALDRPRLHVYQIHTTKGNSMKRRDIIAKLEAAGLTLKEGGNHTKVYRDGAYVSAIFRQRDIAESVARAIEKQTGVKL